MQGVSWCSLSLWPGSSFGYLWDQRNHRHLRTCPLVSEDHLAGEIPWPQHLQTTSVLSVTVLVFVLAYNLEMLQRWPLDLEWGYTSSVHDLKACFKSKVKKMLKRVGVSVQPCLTLHSTPNLPDMSPSNCTVLIMPPWKDLTMLRSFGGQPISGSILNRPFLLTRSNALIRSMKAEIEWLASVLCTSLAVGEGRNHVYSWPLGVETTLWLWVYSISKYLQSV